MAHSRPFGLFLLVSCLVACVCANAVVSRDEATKSVEAAKESAKKVLNAAKDEINDKQYLRREANACKRDAEEAAAEATEAAKGNPEAEAIAQKAKNASAEVLKLYPKVSELVTKYLESIKKLRPRAQELDKNAQNTLYINSWGEDNYTKIKEDADTIKSQADALNKELQTAMGSFEDVADAQNEMLKPATEAQLARYHVDAIVAVAKVKTLLESAERDVKLTEQKRDEINGIIQDMKTLHDNSPKDLINYISYLQNSVEDIFKSASYAVYKAKKAKEDILERKKKVDDALVELKTETDVEIATNEAGNVYWAVKNAEEKLEEIKKALESATSSASGALVKKNIVLNSINAKTKKPDVTQENDKTNPSDSANTHHPVQDTTERQVESETKQPTVTISDQPMSEQPVKDTTESPTVIGTKQPTVTNPGPSMSEQPVKDTTESATVIGTKQPTVTNPGPSMSEQPVKDTTERQVESETKQPTVTISDQPMSEQPVKDTTERQVESETKQPTINNPGKTGSGGTEDTQPSSSDNAMTVFVPLLLALIAYVSFH